MVTARKSTYPPEAVIDQVQSPEVGTLQAGLGKLLKPGAPDPGVYRFTVAMTVPQARMIAVPTELSPVYATWTLKVCKKVKLPDTELPLRIRVTVSVQPLLQLAPPSDAGKEVLSRWYSDTYDTDPFHWI